MVTEIAHDVSVQDAYKAARVRHCSLAVAVVTVVVLRRNSVPYCYSIGFSWTILYTAGTLGAYIVNIIS